MATDEECMAYAREGVRLAGLTDEPKIRFWRTSALRAVTATAGTSHGGRAAHQEQEPAQDGRGQRLAKW